MMHCNVIQYTAVPRSAVDPRHTATLTVSCHLGRNRHKLQGILSLILSTRLIVFYKDRVS